MKCPNCGYECELKYCEMCGTKLQDTPADTPDNNTQNKRFSKQNLNFNPIEEVPKKQHNEHNATAVSTHMPVNPNPVTKATPLQTVPKKVQPDNAHLDKDFTKINPYEHKNNNPVQNSGSKPPLASAANRAPQTACVNMPPSPPQIPVPKQKKNYGKSILSIVLTTFIAAIVIAGILINIFSACVNNISIFALAVNDQEYEDDVVSEDLEDTDYTYSEDLCFYKKGDTVKLKGCNIKLIDSSTKKVSKNPNGNKPKYDLAQELTATFEIKNITDDTVSYDAISFKAYEPNGKSTDFVTLNFNNDKDENKIKIESAKSKIFNIKFYYSVPDDCDKIVIKFQDWSEYDNFDEDRVYDTCNFEVE